MVQYKIIITSYLGSPDDRLRSRNSSCNVPLSAVLISKKLDAPVFRFIREQGIFVGPFKHGSNLSANSF